MGKSMVSCRFSLKPIHWKTLLSGIVQQCPTWHRIKPPWHTLPLLWGGSSVGPQMVDDEWFTTLVNQHHIGSSLILNTVDIYIIYYIYIYLAIVYYPTSLFLYAMLMATVLYTSLQIPAAWIHKKRANCRIGAQNLVITNPYPICKMAHL